MIKEIKTLITIYINKYISAISLKDSLTLHNKISCRNPPSLIYA